MNRRSFLSATAALVAGLVLPARAQAGLRQDRLGDREAWVRPGVKGGPLVLAFHGHGGSGNTFANRIKLHDVWPEATVVYPQGELRASKLDPQGEKSGWQINAGDFGDQDLQFFDALLARYGPDTDPHRIHVIGHSNGAAFTVLLWAVRGARIASLGAASGGHADLIPNVPPRSVFWIMGESDPIVPLAAMHRSIDASRELLHTRKETRTQSGCLYTEQGPGNLEVDAYIHPGGHPFPVEATPLLTAFLQRHPLA